MKLVIPFSCGKLGHILGDMEKGKFITLLSNKKRHDWHMSNMVTNTME
jgi:hypothetical protein